MKYPRLKPKDDKRRKLLPRHIAKAKTMFYQDCTKSQIARHFKVSPNCIAYWIDDELRARKKKQMNEINSARQKNDPVYREYVRKNIRKYFVRRLQDPAFKEYNKGIRNEP